MLTVVLFITLACGTGPICAQVGDQGKFYGMNGYRENWVYQQGTVGSISFDQITQVWVMIIQVQGGTVRLENENCSFKGSLFGGWYY